MKAREFTSDELFAMLVEHPCGMAAMELIIERFRRYRWGHAAAGERDLEYLFLKTVHRHGMLARELSAARAKTRGRT